MNIELLQSSIVVAQDIGFSEINHNTFINIPFPSLITYDKLIDNGIIQLHEDWIVEGTPVSQPPIAETKLKNKISFSVEVNKLIIKDDRKGQFSVDIADVALKFIGKLPDIKLDAVGVNFSVFIENDNAIDLLKEKFAGNLSNEAKKDLRSVYIKLAYSLDESVLYLPIDSGNYTDSIGKKKGIVIEANFHTQIEKRDGIEVANKAVSKFEDKYNYLTRKIKEIFSDVG